MRLKEKAMMILVYQEISKINITNTTNRLEEWAAWEIWEVEVSAEQEEVKYIYNN